MANRKVKVLRLYKHDNGGHKELGMEQGQGIMVGAQKFDAMVQNGKLEPDLARRQFEAFLAQYGLDAASDDLDEPTPKRPKQSAPSSSGHLAPSDAIDELQHLLHVSPAAPILSPLVTGISREALLQGSPSPEAEE